MADARVVDGRYPQIVVSVSRHGSVSRRDFVISLCFDTLVAFVETLRLGSRSSVCLLLLHPAAIPMTRSNVENRSATQRL